MSILGQGDDMYTLAIRANPGSFTVAWVTCGSASGRMAAIQHGGPLDGHSGLMSDILENRGHGKDDRMGVRSFYDAAEHSDQLVKALSSPK